MERGEGGVETDERGSIVATDAPLLPHQLKRLARRVGLGVGRSGAISNHSSADIFLAFSTANADALGHEGRLTSARFVPDSGLDGFFQAVIEAVDEAVLNALVANKAMVGATGRTVHALPHGEIQALLKRYSRL